MHMRARLLSLIALINSFSEQGGASLSTDVFPAQDPEHLCQMPPERINSGIMICALL